MDPRGLDRTYTLVLIAQDTLQRIANSLRILRHRHNCKLPVEIFAFPEELAEPKSSAVKQELENLGGVEFKEVSRLFEESSNDLN